MNSIQFIIGTLLLQSILFVNANDWEEPDSLLESSPKGKSQLEIEEWRSRRSWRSENEEKEPCYETQTGSDNEWDSEDGLPNPFPGDDQDDEEQGVGFPRRCRGLNEKWNPCGNLCPERTCETRNPICIALRGRRCVPRCVCKPGYIRNRFNQCILESRCQCPNNERWIQNGSPCQITCANFNQTCELQKPPLPIDRCYCKPGYARRNGVCIAAATCPNRICKVAHSTINDCGSGRELKCINRKIVWGAVVTTSPRNRCGVRACYCDKGFVRDAINKQCIRASECKRRPITPTTTPKPSEEPCDESILW